MKRFATSILAVVGLTQVHGFSVAGNGRSLQGGALGVSSSSVEADNNTLDKIKAAPAALASSNPSVQLSPLTDRKVVAYDGAELDAILQRRSSHSSKTAIGVMTLVTGTFAGKPVVAVEVGPSLSDELRETVQLAKDCFVYVDSMVDIPSKVSSAQAISTYMASWANVHQVLAETPADGDKDKERVVVVVGGSDRAIFAARGLAATGAQVTLVSTGRPKVAPVAGGGTINVMEPSVGSLELGFAAVVGKFDALLDTLDNEVSKRMLSEEFSPATTGVVQQLRRQHDCHTYVSTYNHAQSLVKDEGVLWGKGKAEQYHKQVCQLANDFARSSSGTGRLISTGELECQYVAPPADLRHTVQTLLSKGVLSSSNDVHRGWTLKDFWELASWPRDAESTVRFGFPTIDDLELENLMEAVEEQRDEEIRRAYERQEAEKFLADPTVQRNPYVTSIHNVADLQEHVLDEADNSLLFVSASYCRKCKALAPHYNRMARVAATMDDAVRFCKADTSGPHGKALGKALGVNAVPAFVLFRNGEMYGKPLSIERLPSPKLEMAVERLQAGKSWDMNLLRSLDPENDEEDEYY